MSTGIETQASPDSMVEHQSIDADIACAGFGPAMGVFSRHAQITLGVRIQQTQHLRARLCQGMPLQILCYERADDIAAGVSGVVTQAKGIRASFPNLNPSEIPFAATVKQERILYLLDPMKVRAAALAFAIRRCYVGQPGAFPRRAR